MHEEFKEEIIVNKVGGRFKLSTLIQKRLVALNRGQPLLLQKLARHSTTFAEVQRSKNRSPGQSC